MENLKYWEEDKYLTTKHTYLVLKDIDNNIDAGRVIKITKDNDELIEFSENCDGYFNAIYTKEQALELLDELKQWITLQR